MPPSSAAAPSGSAEPGASEASDQDQLQEHSQGSSLMTDPSRSHGALLPPLPETLQHSSGWPWSPSAASTGLPAPLLSGIVEPHLPGPSLMLRSSDSGSFELMHQLANSQLLGEGGGLLGEAGLEGLDPLHPSVLAAIHDPGEPGPSEQPRADGTLGLQPPQLPQQQEQQQEQPQQMQMHAEWLLQQLDARAPWPEEGASEGTDQTGSLASAHLVPGLLGALQPKGALGGEECATPPRTGSLGAAQELTARQSSTMGSATRQVLHVAPASRPYPLHAKATAGPSQQCCARLWVHRMAAGQFWELVSAVSRHLESDFRVSLAAACCDFILAFPLHAPAMQEQVQHQQLSTLCRPCGRPAAAAMRAAHRSCTPCQFPGGPSASPCSQATAWKAGALLAACLPPPPQASSWVAMACFSAGSPQT